MKKSEVKLVSKAIVVYKKKVLLLLRDNIPTIHAPNKWSLPGGCGEDKEGPEQTLLRELEEEIGVIPTRFLYRGKSQGRDRAKRCLYFVKLTDEEAGRLRLGDEGQKMEFFSLDQMKNIDLAPKTAFCLKKYGKEAIEDLSKNK